MAEEQPSRNSTVGARPSKGIPSRIVRPSRLLPRRPRALRLNRWVLAALVGLVLTTGGVALISRLTDERHVPAELVGRWETDNALYANRALIFGSDTMIFQSDALHGFTSRIQNIQQRQWPEVTDYVIAGYSDVEGKTTVTLTYLVAEQLIELQNPRGVLWRRVRCHPKRGAPCTGSSSK